MLYIPRIERQKDELDYLTQATHLLKDRERDISELTYEFQRQRLMIDYNYSISIGALDHEFPHIADRVHASE